jgi:hypothetical protein
MAASEAELASVKVDPPAPSFLNTAYPEIEQPPVSAGVDQSIVILEAVEVLLLGAMNPVGKMHE